MMKSTQTNKYETACFVQESPTSSELRPNEAKIHKSKEGNLFVEFPATVITFECYNRMNRRYDTQNFCSVIANDERIQTLKRQNKWRGEWNHPNPEIKGQMYSDIRMTIPEPTRTSHFISNDHLVGNKYRATITTHPSTECGKALTSEIVDLNAVPSFSVRLLGRMIPNAMRNQPNMRVSKVITFDEVDFPSHPNADGDIDNMTMESVVFMKELAQYCCEQDETMKVVCESFGFTPNEITGVHDGGIIVAQHDAKFHIPLKGDIRRECLDILKNRGI